jgi:hypothetical protein
MHTPSPVRRRQTRHNRRLQALLALAAGLVPVLALPAAAAAHLTVLRPNPSSSVTFYGHGGYSSDGGYPGSVVRAEVPAGSTVVQAYLYGTYDTYSGSGVLSASQRTIELEGQQVETTEIEEHQWCASCYLPSTRADVTAQVAEAVGSGGAVTSFKVGRSGVTEQEELEGSTALQGVALVVIYENPSSPLESVAILDGAADSAGDVAKLDFVAPLDTGAPGFAAQMAIGDGYSYQNGGSTHACGPAPQDSIIEVDSKRLTSCAGGSDDGEVYPEHLITVGGIGDSLEDPSNPFTTTEGEEDELYTLTPFLENGETELTIETKNPSGDDDLFLAVIEITADASVGVGAETPPPAAPEPITPPSIPSSAPAEGSTLTAQPGTYSGGETYTYQWQSCTSTEASSCTNITGASSLEYTPGPSLVGSYLRFVVIAANTGGSTTEYSAIVGPVYRPVETTGGEEPAKSGGKEGSKEETTVELTGGLGSNPTNTTSGTASPVAIVASNNAHPSTLACTSQRTEQIHWLVARRVHPVLELVLLDGIVYKRLLGNARSLAVSLVGRGPGAVTVTIVAITRTDVRYSATRTYKPCLASSTHPMLRSRYLEKG